MLRKIPSNSFVSAYPYIKFDEKFQPTCLLEPTRLLERWEYDLKKPLENNHNSAPKVFFLQAAEFSELKF